jgi:hypothetical protein
MIYYVDSSHIRRCIKEAMIKYAEIPQFADAVHQLRAEILREEKMIDGDEPQHKLIRVEDIKK